VSRGTEVLRRQGSSPTGPVGYIASDVFGFLAGSGDRFFSVMEQSLSAYWDWVATTSFHLRQDRPSVTDIFYRQIVLSLINQLTSSNARRILKLDAYNEATNTQYGFYMMDDDRELVLIDISA